jgi:hypothetical protein
MKTFRSNSLLCLFILIIFTCLYYDCTSCTSANDCADVNEGFTPRIREMYRPYLRHSRIFTNNVYNYHQSNIYNLFRKFGLM